MDLDSQGSPLKPRKGTIKEEDGETLVYLGKERTFVHVCNFTFKIKGTKFTV